MSQLSVWLFWFALAEAWFLLRFPLASARGMMTPAEMRAHDSHGIPLTGHGSTWFVLFVLTPLLSLFISLYHPQWTSREILIAGGIGLLLSGGLHLSYLFGKFPEADVRNGSLEPAGWVHFVYMTWAIGVLVLVYAFTKDQSPALLCVLTTYMVAHIWVGNHFPNRINRPDWFPPLPDYPVWAMDAWAPVIATAVILGGLTWWNLK